MWGWGDEVRCVGAISVLPEFGRRWELTLNQNNLRYMAPRASRQNSDEFWVEARFSLGLVVLMKAHIPEIILIKRQ